MTGTMRKLRLAFLAVFAAVLMLDLFVEHHPFFGIDGTFGFGVWFGLAACIAAVIVARAIGWFLKRPEDTYER
jgi:hypothetical protein